MMIQLLDLARENAALKSELARIRKEAAELQRLLAGVSTDLSAAPEVPFSTPRDPVS